MAATTSPPSSSVDLTEEKTIHEAAGPATSFDAPPDGGLRAWLVVVGGFSTYFVSFGLLNSFGTFQVYYSETLLPAYSESAISWIGTVQIFLLFFLGLVCGPVFDKHGTKPLLIPGTLLYVVSLVITSVSTRYYQLILAQGLLYGISNAMLFYPTISAISHWFRARRGLALGIVVSGSSVGGIAWPLLIERLIHNVGFGWAIRIVALICLALLLPACWMVAPRVPLGPKPAIPKEEFTKIFRDINFWLLTIGMFLVMFGMFIPFYYIPLYAIHRGIDAYMANVLIAIVNGGSFFGRLLSGAAADRYGKYNITTLCGLLSGITLMCMQTAETRQYLVAFSAFYGFFSGGLISLQSGCMAQITDNMHILGVRIGFMMSFCSVGALTGGPIAGALVALNSGEYYGLTYFAGTILLAGSVVIAGGRWIQGAPLLRKL